MKKDKPNKGEKMKTAKQIKKEARERFEKEFPKTETHHFGWGIKNGAKVKHFLDQLIDTTIKQTLEGVRVEEMREWTLGADDSHPRNNYISGYNQAVNQQTKLAKEIYENQD